MRAKKISKYNGVAYVAAGNKFYPDKKWVTYVRIKGILIKKRMFYSTEREAAIQADLIFIEHRMYDLINILKPKIKTA